MNKYEECKRTAASRKPRALQGAELEGTIPQHELPREKSTEQDDNDRARAEGEGMFDRRD